ncbi:MAG: acyl-CoA dehydrogenase family protein [Bacteriovoracaceae bacterium]|nr:acyl-CoA dehydrogenase family protein [Bacteriovoracaceae bacterium]
MTPQQKDFLEALTRLCKKNIEPFTEQDEAQNFFRSEVYQCLGENGFAGITTPETFSGMGLTSEDLSLVLAEVAKYSVSYAVTLSVSSMVQFILLHYGNETQKKKYLPALATGQEIGAFSLTESQAGSDASALRLTATKTKEGYLLNGNKLFTTSGGIAKTYIVMAQTIEGQNLGVSAFLVRDETAGFSYGKLEKKMGWKSSPTRELIFENAFIPKENLLGSEGQGMAIALSALSKGRVAIASIACGLARQALESALKYCLQREQFGQTIFNFQGLQFMAADMACELESAWALTIKASLINEHKSSEATLFSSLAKLKATDMAMKVTTDAVQMLGGVGYTAEYPLERYMRDAKGLQIVEGTNQIQRLIIARKLREISLS